MAKAAWENKLFHDPAKAREWLEKLLWPDGPVCGYCGVTEDNSPLATRPGYYQCNACRRQFTVTVGTVFERSHIPLNKWLMAAALLCASKKGVSAHQAHRMLGITYKSAWFMMHRLREAMMPGKSAAPLGGLGKIVEADETYLGKRDGRPIGKSTFVTGFGWVQPRARYQTQRKSVSLVERGGAVRSFKVDSREQGNHLQHPVHERRPQVRAYDG